MPNSKIHPSQIRVLVACEFSGTVRDAFRKLGFDAWSCDLLPCEADPTWHLQQDAIHTAYRQRWDLMIAHPPCTDLAISGALYFAEKRADGRQQAALKFVAQLMGAPIPHIAIENPVGVISTYIRKPEQIIHPWQFGHGETKKTCLWLKDLPKLKPTNIVGERKVRLYHVQPGPDRWRERSITYPGIADAMAQQWGRYVLRQRNARSRAA